MPACSRQSCFKCACGDTLVPENKFAKPQEEDLIEVDSNRLLAGIPKHRPSRTTFVERDPAMPRSWLRTRGCAIVRWLGNPSEPDCPISPHSLTFEQVQKIAEIDDSPSELMEELVLPDGFPPTMIGTYIMVDYEWVTFEGMTGPSLLCLNDIEREKPADSAIGENPHISDVALAFYTRDYAIESLRYVFVNGVVNHQTRKFVKSRMRKVWPPSTQPLKWEYGSQEYEEMLGTRIGRTVGYIVLSAFARGSRRIARILAWTDHLIDSLHFRFDIEPIASTA